MIIGFAVLCCAIHPASQKQRVDLVVVPVPPPIILIKGEEKECVFKVGIGKHGLQQVLYRARHVGDGGVVAVIV